MSTDQKRSGEALGPVTLAALGVVYGDIGTSPLYAIRECFYGKYAVAATPDNVLGVLSLVFWSLVLVISVKYLVFVLRADYHGEGGILALTELVRRPLKGRTRTVIVAVGLFGAALLYGDGIITPAISVLSAVEGLGVATAYFEPYIVSITVVILAGLFAVQRLGTAGVGALFGPVMLLWFATLGLLGLTGIMSSPSVLTAVNPVHALAFFQANGMQALTILGIVFLVVTGGEALYADLGHFGPRPIRLGWYLVVLPGLMLNYFGQGGLILQRGADLSNPFYQLVPSWALYPVVALATAATIIASQAIISGAFSLTFQGQQLGYLPPLRVVHTSTRRQGQIYVPAVNWLLLAATVGLVIGFQRSGNLAAAYGIAISATMLITTLLLFFAQWRVFGWPLAAAAAITLLFLVADGAFFLANIGKIADGGWLPIGVAALVFLVMTTWRRGRLTEHRHLRNQRKAVADYLGERGGGFYRRVPGQAVYLADNDVGTPHALMYNLEHNRTLHDLVVIYTAKSLRMPRVPDDRRIRVERLRDDIWRVVGYHGYLEHARPLEDLQRADQAESMGLELGKATFFIENEVRLPGRATAMSRWRSWLYILMARNARRRNRYYGLPINRVFEIGVRLQI